MNYDFLKEMLKTASVSGQELNLAKKVYAYMDGKCDKILTDEICDVVAVLNPDSKVKVLLTGHLDEIGLAVTVIREDGFLNVRAIGGIYPKTYLGQKVQIMTERGVIYGAVLNSKDLLKKESLETKELLVDIGATSKEDAETFVTLGDAVLFDTDVRELLNNRITARAMDDRVGAFVVMEALLKAKEMGCKVGVYSAATVGEETSMNGAYFVSSRIQPTLAIAVDVTYTSDYPGTDAAEDGTVKLGGGPVICNNTTHSKQINKLLKEAAQRMVIKLQVETCGGRSHTDADVMHKSGKGIPVALVSIPLRNMHTPAEIGCLEDIENCINLLAEFVCSLTQDLNLNPFEQC